MRKNVYFISDTHLGLYPLDNSLEREKKLVRWLNEIRHNAAEIYLVGDIFDFWHEYKRVVPKGFTRFLGTLALMADEGVKIHFFSGNHDVWMYRYFKDEIGASIYHRPIIKEINGKRFYIGHGDGLGPGDIGFKLLKWAFTNKFLQWCFARFHPNFAMWLGYSWSKKSRYAKGIVAEEFAGLDKELTIMHSKQILSSETIDYFVYGHRHIPSEIKLDSRSIYYNLGDWIYSFTYCVYDGKSMELKQYEGKGEKIIRLSV